MKLSIVALSLVALTLSAAMTGTATAAQGVCAAKLTQEPVVMRIGKDEFRIAFGINAEQCTAASCVGSIKYQTTWQTEDGATNVEHKQLSYEIPHGANRSIAVDRHYFDTSEGKHTTNVVRVSVEQVSCMRAAATANLAER